MSHSTPNSKKESLPELIEQWRDPDLARILIEGIAARAEKLVRLQQSGADKTEKVSPLKIMEVCGTHTMAIAKWGLRAVLPSAIKLISGPGCPVCVTANQDLDLAIELAKQPGVIVATFGDMMKVPGSYESLSDVKAKGHDVRIVYSPLDALALAEQEPGRQVIFIGVGFETTAPLIAATIKRAEALQLENFSVCAIHKTVPKALRALADDAEVQVAGFILPGHVSTIIGLEPYQFLAQDFNVPSVIAGFEPVDILQSIVMLLDLALEKAHAEIGRNEGSFEARVDLAYTRGVRVEGNPAALAALEEVFEPCDAVWRGLGEIPGTGLTLRSAYAKYNAALRFDVQPPPTREPKGCQCGDILRGIISPHDCRLFGHICTPENPIGPCMVSSEGSCAAWYRYYGTAATSVVSNTQGSSL
ncbi:MAG: hydrogenase formation protein HypD [Coriobacteriia bacterium]|nr:hydrogenase formation protein HypD [Coriobacteriia bacterium]